MASYDDWFDEFIDEVRTLVKAQWTDITDAKFFTQFQAEHTKVIDLMLGRFVDTSDVAIIPPFAVIVYGKDSPEQDFGIQNYRSCRQPIEIWRIEKQSLRAASTNEKVIHGKLWELRESIFAASLTTFEVVEPPEIESGATNQANTDILSSGYHWIAGCVRWWNPGVRAGVTGL